MLLMIQRKLTIQNTNASDKNKEPEKNTVYYVTDVVQQGQYIKLFKEQGMNAVILDHNYRYLIHHTA